MTNQNNASAQNAPAVDAELNKGETQVEINGEDLNKALDAVSSIIKASTTGRESDLLAKAQNGTATPAERAELVSMLNGTASDSLAKSVSAPLDPRGNEVFAKSIDASDYIATLHKSLTTSFDAVAKAMQSSDEAREREIVVLAKALVEIGKVVSANARLTKSLEQKLETWGRQPANTPRSQNPANRAPIAKGLAGATGEAGAPENNRPRVRREAILDGLVYLSEQNGSDRMAKSGETYAEAVSRFESSNEIHPTLMEEVLQLLGNGQRGNAS